MEPASILVVLIVFLVIGAGLMIWYLRTRDRPRRDIEDLPRRRRSPLVEADALYDVAWAYTRPRRPFTLLAEELLPLLRERLTHGERLDLVAMLFSVAGAHSATGELQRRAILRLRHRLIAASPAPRASRTDDSAR